MIGEQVTDYESCGRPVSAHCGHREHRRGRAACLARRMDVTRFTYVGPPPYAGALAQDLEAQGISVDYQPPMETKDVASAMSAVAVVFAATGPIKDIISSVRAFKVRFAGTRVEGLPDDEGPSLRERLGRLDELKADGTITADEHAQQRARILGEL